MERRLVFVKLLHFLSCFAGAAWGRYQGIYLNTHRHLSPFENGLVRGGGLFAKFVFTPLWGAWSDTGDPRTLLVLSVTSCALLFHFYRLDATYSHFVCLLLLKVVRSGANGSGTLVDIITLRMVSGTSEGYGSQRLWTAVAWGLGSWGAGKAIDAYGFEAIWWWYYCGTAALLLLLIACPYGRHDTEGTANWNGARRTIRGTGGQTAALFGESAGQKRMSSGPLETLREFYGFVWPTSMKDRLRGPGAASRVGISDQERKQHAPLGRFFCHIIVASLVMALVESILFLQMERDFHSARSLMGTVTLVGTISEYLPFMLSKRLLSHCGARFLMVFSQAALVLRLVLLSTVTVESSSKIVLIQVLHGACFACFWIAAVDYANSVAPQDMKGTAQSLVSTCMYIVGPGIGSVVWSYIYQIYNAPIAYACGAAVAATNALAIGKLQLALPEGKPVRPAQP